MNIRDRHLLGRLERLFAEQEEEAPDFAGLSDEEVRTRLADAKHGAVYGLATGDFSQVMTHSPFALLSDEEIKRRLRVAQRKVAAKALAGEGVPARSIAGLLFGGDPR